MLYTKDAVTWRVCLLALCMLASQEKIRIRGVAANCPWGHTVSDPKTQRGRFYGCLSKLGNSLMKG